MFAKPEPGTALARALREALGSCDRVLDVGCGDQAALVRRIPELTFTVGVDLALPAPDASFPTHTEYRELDIRTLAAHFEPGSFSCVVALDVIEHLTREEGAQLLDAMEQIASKRVIVFTPNGFLAQEPTPENPHQEHISGWTVTDFTARGYRVQGINGWRPLRGPYAEIRWRPLSWWLRLSTLTERFTSSHAAQAFQLFAVKDVEREDPAPPPASAP